MEEFLEKISKVYTFFKPSSLSTAKHLDRLPNIEFKFTEFKTFQPFEPHVYKQLVEDNIYKLIKFEYGSDGDALKISEAVKVIQVTHLREFFRLYLANPYSMRNALIETHLGVFSQPPPINRLIFYPGSYTLSDYKTTVEDFDRLFYSRQIETDFFKFDVYTDVFQNKKALEFLDQIKGRKYHQITVSNAGAPYPSKRNQPTKNLLLQIIGFKHTLEIGGRCNFSRGFTKNSFDMIILLSRLFENVDFFMYPMEIGYLGISIYAKKFIGISHDLYTKLLEELLRNEELDIQLFFKVDQYPKEYENIKALYSTKLNEIGDWYMEHREEIIKQKEKINAARFDRTINDIYKYFIQED